MHPLLIANDAYQNVNSFYGTETLHIKWKDTFCEQDTLIYTLTLYREVLELKVTVHMNKHIHTLHTKSTSKANNKHMS
jgi:hypothetical protein